MLEKQQQQQEMVAGQKHFPYVVSRGRYQWLFLVSLLNTCNKLFPLISFGPVAAPLLCDPVAAATSSSVLNVAALLASGTQVTPQIAMAAQMAALQAKTLAETGIAVPSYYNPSAVNPVKFAEQEKKRKMLWQGKKEGVRQATFTKRSSQIKSFLHICVFTIDSFDYLRAGCEQLNKNILGACRKITETCSWC